MSRLRPMLIFGTRPEAIKMAPVVRECRRRNDAIDPIVCLTGQHREMLQQVTDYFEIEADIDLALMRPNQSLAEITARCLTALDETVQRSQPHCLVAQGDTTTVMAASIISFYRRMPFVHVEAGLRTGNLNAPWPEEFNRRVTGIVSALHCAPTATAANHLLAEKASPANVHVTGNTVIDALLWTVGRERLNDDQWRQQYRSLESRRMVLITGHRRENFGEGFQNICDALEQLAERFAEVAFVYPVHLNPNVRGPVHERLGDRENILLVPPAPYPEFVWLMDRADVILTDSGGVQEEAPSLRKPVLVMRETTERPEAVDAGAVELVGTSREKIVDRVSSLLCDPQDYAAHLIETNPYGDGRSAPRIVDLMLEQDWAR